ncbi:MAG: pilus assembly protein [Rubripirellula sp.]|nr:pilus assembly protein [Rubripirellula sp.]
MNSSFALNTTNRQQRIWRRRKPRVGAVMVEFAIVANLLFCMIFVSFEFARFHLARNLTQDAAYYAARQAMVPGATAAEAKREATKILSAMFSQGYEVVIAPLGQQADSVVVTVSVDLHKVAFFAPMFLPDGKLTSVATLKTERYRGYYRQATS